MKTPWGQRATLTAVHLAVLAAIYFSLRLPLADKPYTHDELYNTSTYLKGLPTGVAEYFTSGEIQKNQWDDYRFDWSRQLATHPPFLTFFYCIWTNVFGDSEISLHVPTIIAGLLSIICMYFLVRSLSGKDVGFVSALAMTVCLAHVIYSTQAVHAVFELAVFTLTLFLFWETVVEDKKEKLPYLFLANVLGVLIFYHYLVYLSLQTVLFIFLRRRVQAPKLYFVCVGLALFLLAWVFIAAMRSGMITHGEWIWADLTGANFAKTIGALPFHVLDAHGYSFQTFTFEKTMYVLPVFFVAGTLAMLFCYRGKQRLFFIFSLLLFVAPFAAYFVISFFQKNFGGPRNFVYLLPIYFVAIFAGLDKIIPRKIGFYIASAALISLSARIGLKEGSEFANRLYAGRRMIALAGKIDEDYALVETSLSGWVVERYARDLGMKETPILWGKRWKLFSMHKEAPSIAFFTDRNRGRKGDSLGMGKLSVEIVEMKIHEGRSAIYEYALSARSPLQSRSRSAAAGGK